MAHPGSRPARAVIRAEVGHGTAELVGDPDRPQGWTLLVDGTAQSHVDLDDPVHLEFEYIRRIGHLIDLCAPPYAALRALHLGGGAWTLARYVAATRPGSAQTVVELDGPLAEFVGHRLPADGMGIDVKVSDARAARTLAPGGTYAANVADGGPALAFAGSQVAAARAAFQHVAVVAPPDVLRGRRFGNLVLVASSTRLPIDDLRRFTASDPFPARVLAGSDLDRFTAAARTDRTAVPSPMPPPGFWGR